jgi:hypothetical protein
MRRTYSMNSGFGRAALRLAALTAACLPTASADAQPHYVYSGYNIVSMPGAACRTERFSREISEVDHDRITRVKTTNQYYTRLYCPLPRRGLGLYSLQVIGVNPNVAKLQSVVVRGYDGSVTRSVGCAVFMTNMYTQSTTWSAAARLCTDFGSCMNPQPFTGAATMEVPVPADASSIPTVNFGLMCTVPSNSSIDSYEAYFLPND